MNFCMNDMLYAFSYALDCVEHDLLGVTTYHGPRVAAMSAAMGRKMGFSEDELLDLAGCAILHDNALTEYIQEERGRGIDAMGNASAFNPSPHCITGEKNIKAFPFQTNVSNIVLYHHENADGSGPFGKKACDTPVKAQIIHMADQLDAAWNFGYYPVKKHRQVLEFAESEQGRMFSRECVDLFKESCPADFLAKLNRERSIVVLRELLPVIRRDYGQDQVMGICTVMAKIIDYKSEFTKRHSLGIARKARAMGSYYGWGKETETQLYFAGALHDIGKLIVDSNILEKPDKLTDKEYKHIQNHAYKTFEILSQIDGLGEVTYWAALHHERLDGRGYPFGKAAGELNKKERLMACLDIYQALTEERPYKKGMEHGKTIGILRDMAARGQIDRELVEDIDSAYCKGCLPD